ncbi:MAG: hypothetical protein COA32_09775 [Fluviicola sp.]|nr:MAG: hypothetical protein COA32_09775 [Fluviicola sp.]
MNMKVTIASILLIFTMSCSDREPQEKLTNVNASKDMPTPKSIDTTTNPNEDLAPQACYYGCKARK